MNETNDPWAALAAPTTRAPRSLETRAKTESRKPWVQPSTLPEIEPRDGWTHKWVRTGADNTPDKRTYQSRLREGWEPIDLADYPELWSHGAGRTTGHCEVGNLIACRMPDETARERNESYVNNARQAESDAEEHYMRDNSELVKKFRNNSRKRMFGQLAR